MDYGPRLCDLRREYDGKNESCYLNDSRRSYMLWLACSLTAMHRLSADRHPHEIITGISMEKTISAHLLFADFIKRLAVDA